VSTEGEQTPSALPRPEAGAIGYHETLRTPWWWYPVAVGVAVVLAAEFHIADYSLTDWIPYLVLVPFSIAVVWWLGRGRLAIDQTEVSIRGAHVALRYVGTAVALDARTLRRVIGREGDPRAYVAIRPWIGPGVQFQLVDPDDPTPYWVISTRHPEDVVRRLTAGRGSQFKPEPRDGGGDSR